MPIIGMNTTEDEASPVIETPVPKEETQKSIAVDNHIQPLAGMKAYLDGYPWSVTYYRQLLGQENDIRDIDPAQAIANQQYEKINDLEIRVESPLSPSFDQSSGLTSTVGSSIVPYLIPNVNDYIVAEAGNRDAGIFRVTSVERKTFNRDSAWRIDYTMVGFVGHGDTETIKANLDVRSIREYYFSKERQATGLGPFLAKKEHQLNLNCEDAIQMISRDYLDKFFNLSHLTLLVPGQNEIVYDPMLVPFAVSQFERNCSPVMSKIKVIGIENERYLAQDNIWTAIKHRNHRMLSGCNKEMVLAHKRSFVNSHWLKGNAYWNLDYYVYPKDANTELRLPSEPVPVAGTLMITGTTPPVDQIPFILKNQSKRRANMMIIHPVIAEGSYVFSKSFYEGKEPTSVMEILVRDYLKKETLDVGLLDEVITSYYDWPILEQYYMGPILVLLLRSYIQGIY